MPARPVDPGASVRTPRPTHASGEESTGWATPTARSPRQGSCNTPTLSGLADWYLTSGNQAGPTRTCAASGAVNRSATGRPAHAISTNATTEPAASRVIRPPPASIAAATAGATGSGDSNREPALPINHVHVVTSVEPPHDGRHPQISHGAGEIGDEGQKRVKHQRWHEDSHRERSNGQHHERCEANEHHLAQGESMTRCRGVHATGRMRRTSATP